MLSYVVIFGRYIFVGKRSLNTHYWKHIPTEVTVYFISLVTNDYCYERKKHMYKCKFNEQLMTLEIRTFGILVAY